MTKQIGILVSTSYGGSWSTWEKPEMALDQELVKAFEEKKEEKEIMTIAEKNWPEEYMGGLMDCMVYWVDEGTKFIITECDGAETLILEEDLNQVAK